MGSSKKNKNNDEVLGQLGMGINDKLRYLSELIHSHYESDTSFFLLKHEYTFLANFIIKDNVYVSDSPIFTYNGKRYSCVHNNSSLHRDNLLNLNWQCVFHDMRRNNVGELMIMIKILTEDLLDD